MIATAIIRSYSPQEVKFIPYRLPQTSEIEQAKSWLGCLFLNRLAHSRVALRKIVVHNRGSDDSACHAA